MSIELLEATTSEALFRSLSEIVLIDEDEDDEGYDFYDEEDDEDEEEDFFEDEEDDLESDDDFDDEDEED